MTSNFQIYNASAGSGKTFTLVKEYLKIVLSTDDMFRFQQILAITFTNKAAAEMKTRIIDGLKKITDRDPFPVFDAIQQDTGIPEEILIARAEKVLNSIIQNYSAFSITTIDKFTHRIIRNFAFDLGLSLNFDVELDADAILSEAVDSMISKVGADQELTKILVQYATEKIDDDKSWNIASDLKDIARVLLKEQDIEALENLKDKKVEDFIALKNKLKEKKDAITSNFRSLGSKAIDLILENTIPLDVFPRQTLPNFFKRSRDKFEDLKIVPGLHKTLREGEVLYKKSIDEDMIHSVEGISDQLRIYYFEILSNLSEYNFLNMILTELIPLAVLQKINISLQEIKSQNNIHLLSEFNMMISNEIKGEPAPFIYERLGEKYRYYFIDEMQDTSGLQWKNLIPLIENALTTETLAGEVGSLMLVGDGKQAIYRWRGGDSRQFISLTTEETSDFSIKPEVKNLDTNYRSAKNIVDFTNSFFTQTKDFLSDNTYVNLYEVGNNQKNKGNEGGYVEIEFLEHQREDKAEVFGEQVYQTIVNLQDDFELNEICLLVRSKKEGVLISDYLTLKKIPIVSSETLLLKNNKSIQLILCLLNYLKNNDDKVALASALQMLSENLVDETQVHQFISDRVKLEVRGVFESLQNFGIHFSVEQFESLPLYEGIELLINSLGLFDIDQLYVIAFLDFVLEFQMKNGSDLVRLIEYWEEKGKQLSVALPEGQNAVQIMTVHKSKGLEFPVVILPFDIDLFSTGNNIPKIWYSKFTDPVYEGFQNLRIPHLSKLRDSTSVEQQQEYQYHRNLMQLDSMNLLYVALTRPIEQLYIFTSRKKKYKDINEAATASDLFHYYLSSDKQNFNEYDPGVKYTLGDKHRVFKGELSELKTSQLSQVVSTTKEQLNVAIVTNASLLWETDREAAISYGNLIHELLSKIIDVTNIGQVLNLYKSKGMLDAMQYDQVVQQIDSIVNHSELKAYYKKGVRVLNEQEIYSDGVYIPDRLIFEEDGVVIIDYKTGERNKKYAEQLNSYEQVLKKIGYHVKDKILVYLQNEDVLIEKL